MRKFLFFFICCTFTTTTINAQNKTYTRAKEILPESNFVRVDTVKNEVKYFRIDSDEVTPRVSFDEDFLHRTLSLKKKLNI